jgi:hypothetical protein
MKKITKKNFAEKLAKYGAMSLAIAGVADAAGQVVYTDVDPDFVGGMGDSFAIDFDGDSTDDITVLQSNNGNYELVQALPAGGNGVIAASNAGYFYASNLAYGASISAGAGSFRSFGSFCAGVGYAGSQFCGTGEGYIGVEFAVGGDTHYGWVRVDVADSSNFIVLDYAYESTPNMAIAAGDMGSLGVGDQAFEGFAYFVDSNNNLNLSANSTMEAIAVYNVLGQEVISQKLSGTSEAISISNLKSGVYLATVSIEGTKKTIKFVRK